MEQTYTGAAHPQSNGKLERFHRTFKSEHVRRAAYVGREDAIERMRVWIRYYNEARLCGICRRTMCLTAGWKNGLQSADKNCILHILTGKAIGGPKSANL
jgi:hypothetical protein